VHDDTDASDCSVSDEDDSDIPPDDPPPSPPDPLLSNPHLSSGMPAMLIDAYLSASHHSFTTTPIDLFPSTVIDLLSLAALEGGVPKLQHALTVQYEDVVAARFSKSQPLSKRACTASHSTSGSKSVHTTYLDLSSRLPPAAAITTAKIRTGTLDLPNRICRCGDVTLTTSHCLSCKKLRGRFVRHDLGSWWNC